MKVIDLTVYILKKPKFYKYLFFIIVVVGLFVYSLFWAILFLLIIIVGLIFRAATLNIDFPVTYNERFLQNPLYFPINSNELFTGNLKYDENGAVYNNYGGTIGKQYNPAYVAWHGITNLQKWLDTKDDNSFKVFQNQIAWLKQNFKDWGEKGVVWTYDFDWQEGLKGSFKAPWISAMAQGLAISLLIRASSINNDEECLKIANKAIKVFEVDIKDGGVRHTENGYILYEEYPAYPLAHVLDGFIFALLGLYDLWRATGENHIKELFDNGIKGLEYKLEFWNYRNKWSWYGSHGYLCPAQYNKLNASLLTALYHITGISEFDKIAKKWMPESKSFFDKIEINVMRKITMYFALLKRLCYIKGIR